MARKKILVADDSLTIQKVIRLALSNEGYEIQTVSNGNDALQQIPLFRPDVVLVDISLPGKSAFELKRMINAHEDTKDVRFILMSNAFEKTDEAQVKELQFSGQLVKPFDPANLRQILDKAIADIAVSQAMAPAKALAPEQQVIETSPVDDIWGKDTADDPDIRNLTESTIKLSGLDDFQWSVKEPSLKPPPGMLDSGETTFQIDQFGSFEEMETPIIKTPPPPPPLPHEAIELPETTKQTAPQNLNGELDEKLEKSLESHIEKAIHRMLPDIAERLIKDEIRRMLHERP
ncbi:MAG: response regulator [Bdellovibrionota bacterium]